MKAGSGTAGSRGREPDEPDIDDRRLVSAYLRSRDEAAFRALFHRHTPALYLLALRLEGGRSSEADDVVQEAWVRAIARLSAFEWRSALRTWLAGFVVRCSRELRRRPAAGPLDDEIVGLDEAHPDTRLDLERALRRLPDGYREVVVLHDCEGWPMGRSCPSQRRDHLSAAEGGDRGGAGQPQVLVTGGGARVVPAARPRVGRLAAADVPDTACRAVRAAGGGAPGARPCRQTLTTRAIDARDRCWLLRRFIDAPQVWLRECRGSLAASSRRGRRRPWS